jgi:hypothetical protein
MLGEAAQDEFDVFLLQPRSDIAEPFDQKLVVTEIGVMRAGHQLQKHRDRFTEKVSRLDGGRKRSIVIGSLRTLHPVNHAGSLGVGAARSA